MDNYSNFFQAMEKLHGWHNANMAGTPYTDRQINELRGEIIELMGLDLTELFNACQEIDGCCFAIQQGGTSDPRDEVSIIDGVSSRIQRMISDCTGIC